MQQQQSSSLRTGLTGLALLWAIILIATGSHLWNLAIGENGRRSTNKSLILIWTTAVVFGFLARFQVGFDAGLRDALPDVVTTLLIAMGISVVAAVPAKSVVANGTDEGDSNASAACGGRPGRSCA